VELGDAVDAYDVHFGVVFIGSFDANSEEGEEKDPVSHLCMVVGQHYQKTRRVHARCERGQVHAIVRAYVTCFQCLAYKQERNMPL
jgi:hypothetical protein